MDSGGQAGDAEVPSGLIRGCSGEAHPGGWGPVLMPHSGKREEPEQSPQGSDPPASCLLLTLGK